MAGCGKVYNGGHTVEGLPLRCGVNLYWRLPEGKPNDKARRCEAVLCEECRNGENNEKISAV
jgi:predicted  nucleic acid-binding Zn-ribbon protein